LPNPRKMPPRLSKPPGFGQFIEFVHVHKQSGADFHEQARVPLQVGDFVNPGAGKREVLALPDL
jgi:hypothetical protein